MTFLYIIHMKSHFMKKSYIFIYNINCLLYYLILRQLKDSIVYIIYVVYILYIQNYKLFRKL